MSQDYYRITSEGTESNLQLYAFRQAKRYWSELRKDYEDGCEGAENLKERCVFVLSILGLSVSQLLGQNNKNVKSKVPSPFDLFADFVDSNGLDPALKEEFKKFNKYYNGCRHFGLTTTGESHQLINALTFPVAKECFDFGLKVWKTVIEANGLGSESEVKEFLCEEVGQDTLPI